MTNKTKTERQWQCFRPVLTHVLLVFPWTFLTISTPNLADLAEGCTGYKWLTDADRHHTFAAPQIKCDRKDITEKSWYRFGSDSGTQMLTTCIAPYHCNTHAPGWLFNGTHPEMHEGIVSRRVCFHWLKNCCHFKTDIKVRNCGSFYAYKLGPPSGCSLRYCGE